LNRAAIVLGGHGKGQAARPETPALRSKPPLCAPSACFGAGLATSGTGPAGCSGTSRGSCRSPGVSPPHPTPAWSGPHARGADRNFKRPSGPRLPTTLLRVTGLMLPPSLGAAWLACAIWATSRLRRRAFGRCRATKPASRTARMAPTPAFTAA